MIRTITGTAQHLFPDGVVVDVGGVGYLVAVPARSAPRIGDAVSYMTYHHIREDGQALYGFTTSAELATFQLLITVPSIGPKLAMAILAVATPSDIASAVDTDNIGFFSSLPGVGKKSAAKIIVELKGKITASREVSVPGVGVELVDALTTLGYAPSEIQGVLARLPREHTTIQAQVTWALRELSQ